jgi:glycerol-3-phosphate dehydrogenase
MKVYDMMAGNLGLGPSEHISKEDVLKAIPNLSEEDLTGGVIYYDGQFDDARLAVNLAQTIHENGGSILNYMKVTDLIKTEQDMICGVEAQDMETGQSHTLFSKVVINATGVFVDSVMNMDNAEHRAMVAPSQGVHIVLDRSFLQGDSAIMIPKTSDGRVLFAVPWHGKVIVGTTDTPLKEISLEPRALEEEIEFILETAAQYLEKDPARSDVLSVFAGLRPLAAPDGEDTATKEISRSHKLVVSLSGLVTITGGKWTTYRKMAQDTMDKAAMIAGLEDRKCVTRHMPIHGFVKHLDFSDHLYIYGADRVALKALIASNPELGERLDPALPYLKVEVVWAVRHEMARTLEDVLARRTRALLLDARVSMKIAERTARIMATELNWNRNHEQAQVSTYMDLAEGYILKEK